MYRGRQGCGNRASGAGKADKDKFYKIKFGETKKTNNEVLRFVLDTSLFYFGRSFACEVGAQLI